MRFTRSHLHSMLFMVFGSISEGVQYLMQEVPLIRDVLGTVLDSSKQYGTHSFGVVKNFDMGL